MKSIIFIIFSIIFSSILNAETWLGLKEIYEETKDSQVLLEIGKLGDKDAIPYLKEIVSNAFPLNQEIDSEELDRMYARGGAEYKKALLYRGTMQGAEGLLLYKKDPGKALTALAKLGDKESLERIKDEAKHENKFVRYNALMHLIEMNDSSVAPLIIQFYDKDLDGFMMRRFTGEVISDALAGLVRNPPVAKGNYLGEKGNVTEKWKKWWKEHAKEYGGTGNEVTLDVANTVDGKSIPEQTVEEVVEAVKEASKPVEEKAALTEIEREAIAEETEPESNNLFLYILGALAVIAVLFVVIRKK